MSSFIKVTDLTSGWDIIIFTHRIAGVVPHHQIGSIVTGVDGENIEVVESIEEIEAQLLRDEFAMATLSGAMEGVMFRNLVIDDAVEAAYEIADAMLKERLK